MRIYQHEMFWNLLIFMIAKKTHGSRRTGMFQLRILSEFNKAVLSSMTTLFLTYLCQHSNNVLFSGGEYLKKEKEKYVTETLFWLCTWMNVDSIIFTVDVFVASFPFINNVSTLFNFILILLEAIDTASEAYLLFFRKRMPIVSSNMFYTNIFYIALSISISKKVIEIFRILLLSL